MDPKKTYIKVNLPQELKDEFRLVCAAEGITITSKMIFLMRQEVEKNKNLIKEAKKLKGIPSSAQLGNEFRSGRVTGQDIVQAAIDSCYLNNDYGMETNPNFARDVESQLEAIYAGS